MTDSARKKRFVQKRSYGSEEIRDDRNDYPGHIPQYTVTGRKCLVQIIRQIPQGYKKNERDIKSHTQKNDPSSSLEHPGELLIIQPHIADPFADALRTVPLTA